ncbi:inositol monophosphatase family protein [Paenibacillus mesotrionivorans]|uniref:Inositol monophosphatase family protein n=1 Tax=Paenibacillus mesotrionivorans TaxID=3160968 RepID=A0ACC7NUC8_9BACL
MFEKFINNLSVLSSELRHVSCRSRKLIETTNEVNAYGEMSLYIDKLFEDIIIKHLAKEPFVQSIYSEESGIIQLRNEGYIVIVDPLDGTQNFKMGLSYYAVTIAVLNPHLEVEAAYVVNLVSGNYYSAVKGKGALCNGSRFYTRKQSSIREVDAIYVGLSRNVTELNCLSAITQRIKSFRAMGCASLDLCCLAIGNCGLFLDLSYTAKLVDVLASSFIAEEAGALVTSLIGIPITDIPSKSTSLSDAVFKSKFQVLGAANTSIYDFAYNTCMDMEMRYNEELV